MILWRLCHQLLRSHGLQMENSNSYLVEIPSILWKVQRSSILFCCGHSIQFNSDMCISNIVMANVKTYAYRHVHIHTRTCEHIYAYEHIYVCCWFRCSGTSKRFSNRKEYSSAECRIRISDTKSPADWMPADKLTELWRIKHTHTHTHTHIYIYIHMHLHIQ